ALQLKGLPDLNPETVKAHFHQPNLSVVNSKEALGNLVKEKVAEASSDVCLLLMSSGTFEGMDWERAIQ
ncbi:MAG: hypothetical protein ABI378_11925, partial [Chitinophagaceae bacterium]